MKFIHPHLLLQVACVAVVAFGVNGTSWGAEPNIVGNWKIVSFFDEELATGKQTNPLGEHPNGYLIYTPGGRMMTVVVHETRSPPKVDEDRINLHRYMFAYSGRYTVEGDKVVHHVDVSWRENVNVDLVRFFKLEGDRLTITTAPALNPITGAESTNVLIWERER